MAEAFFNRLSKKDHAVSAGMDPYYIKHYGARIPQKDPVIKCMSEEGFDFSDNMVKMASRDTVKKADIIVALMDKKRAARDLPMYIKRSPSFRLWEVHDVNGRQNFESGYKKYLANRERIKGKVKALVKELEHNGT